MFGFSPAYSALPYIHVHEHMGVCAYRCIHTHALTHTTSLSHWCTVDQRGQFMIHFDSIQTYLLTFCIDCYSSSLPYCWHLSSTGENSGALAKTEQTSRLDFNFLVINHSLYNLSWCRLCSLFRELQDIKIATLV